MTYQYRLALFCAAGICMTGAQTARAEGWYDRASNYPSQAPVNAPVTAPQEAQDDWSYKLGAGVGYVPEYEGSDNYTVAPLPIAEADYKDGLFFANLQHGIGSYPLQGEDYKLGGSIGYAFGRDEDDDNDNLDGMGDVDGSVTANLMGEYQIGPGALMGNVTTALSGDYGTTVDVKYGSRIPVSEDTTLMGSIGTTWADEEHMSNYFGVSSRQSARSGYAAHDAGSGFKSVGVTAGVSHAITPSWNAGVTVKADQLIGDTADSPVVKNEFNPSVFATTSYNF